MNFHWIRQILRKLGAADRLPRRPHRRQPPLWVELLEDRIVPVIASSVQLTYGGPGTNLVLTELDNGTLSSVITLSELSPGQLTINLGANHFASSSTSSATGLTYPTGNGTTSDYATIAVSSGAISALQGNLTGDTLDLTGVADLYGGIGSVTANAAAINVTGANTFLVGNSSVTLLASGNLTVAANATLNTGTGTITLAADVNADGTGNANTDVLAIDSGATVVSSSGSASAITLRGDAVNIATGPNAAVVGGDRVITTTAATATLSQVNYADALAFDSQGDLFAANFGSSGLGSTVSEFAPGSTAPTTTLTTQGGPAALAFNSQGDLFVADSGASSVSEFAPGSSTSSFTYSALLGGAKALAFDSQGDLFVANHDAGTVSEFKPKNTTAAATLTGLIGPAALAFDSQGDLFVANQGSSTVSEFSPGLSDMAPLSGLSDPVALAFDTQGDLFVANSGNNTVSEFAPGSTTAKATLTGLNDPAALAFDAQGNLFVANKGTSTLSEFAPGSTVATATFTGVSQPAALAFDSHGDLFVANAGATVTEFEATGTVAAAGGVVIRTAQSTEAISIGGSGNGTGLALSNAELAQIVTSANGTITFGDGYQTGNITFQNAIMPGAGTFVFQSPGGAGQIILDNSAGTALNGNGGSILLQAGTGGIVEKGTNTSGTADLATTGPSISLNAGGTIGTSSQPLQIATDSNTAQQVVSIGSTAQPSAVFVAGLGNLTLGNVDTFPANTTLNVTAVANLTVASGSTIDTGTGPITLAAGVNANGTGNSNGTLEIKSGADVVTSNANSNAITLRGAAVNIDTGALVGARPVVTTNEPTNTLTDTAEPGAMAFDSHGDLFVANQDGTVSEFAPGSTTATATLFGLSNPDALAFDSYGNLFVANAGGNFNGPTVSEFAPGSTTPTATLSGLDGPGSMAFDSHGNLFVANADPFNGSTVSEFAPGNTTPTATLSYLSVPEALAFDAQGNLFVSNGGNGTGTTVSEFAPGSTTPTNTLSELNEPGPLAFDSQGDLFVANFGPNPEDGGTVSEFKPGTITPFAILSGVGAPAAMAFDRQGDLFVVDEGVREVGDTVDEFAPGSTTPTAFLGDVSDPDGLAFDSHGNLFVASVRGFFSEVGEFAATSTSPAAGGVVIRTAQPGQSMNIGGTSPSGANINLSSAELAQIYTTAGGTITFGDSSQTGNITLQDATPATTAGASIDAVQSTSGAGAIVLDNSAGTALSGNGSILLIAGTGGIVEKSTNSSGSADLSTTGPTISLNSTGPIGSSSKPLQIADDSNSAQQNVSVGTVAQPSGAWLDGLGNLTLGNVCGARANTTLSVTAIQSLSVAANATLNTGTGTISLAADVSASGVGNSNTAALTIGAGAIVVSANTTASAITLRGDAVTIATGALVGGYRVITSTTPIATITGHNGPGDLAFDGQGNLFVDYFGNTVSEFAPGSTTPSATLTGLDGAAALAFDSQGNLFVANSFGGTVSEFAPGSTTATATLTGLNFPVALAFDTRGDLFVANERGSTVSEFAPGSTTATTILTGLNSPDALAFDRQGDLFVANGYTTTVNEFAPGSTSPTATLTGLNDPFALAVDKHGNLFVANGGTTTVSEFAPGSTTPTFVLSDPDGADSTQTDYPEGLAFDGQGDLFVANAGTDFDPSGSVSEFAPGSTTPTANLTGPEDPFALAFDSHGNLFVEDDYGTVSEFAATQTVATAGGVVIRTAQSSEAVSIGTGNAGLALSNAELARIVATAAGSITFGDSSQTGNITFKDATPATTSGESVIAVQATAGNGTIVLDDSSGIALSAGAGSISLTAGTGGITGNTSDNTAELAATGKVTLNTTGGIGTSTNRIQFDATNTPNCVTIGSTNVPASGVYLGGLGNLTLGAVTIHSLLDVTVAGELTFSKNVTTTGNLSAATTGSSTADIIVNANVTLESTLANVILTANRSINEIAGALLKSDTQAVCLNYNSSTGNLTLNGSVKGAAGATKGAPVLVNNKTLPVASMAFTTPPINALATPGVLAQVVVTCYDRFGNIVPGASVSLTLQPSAGKLTGTTTVTTNAQGQAVFTTLSIAVVGTYSFLASVANTSGFNSGGVYLPTIAPTAVTQVSTSFTISANPSTTRSRER